MRRLRFFLIISLALVLVTAGCSLFTGKKEQWKPVKPEKRSFVHTVRFSGETLNIVARWYTGSEKYAKSLADANPNINSNHLLIGDRVFIPKDLLKVGKSMPEKFVKKILAKPKKKKAKKKTSVKKKKIAAKPELEKPKNEIPPPKPEPPSEENELDLFGPK